MEGAGDSGGSASESQLESWIEEQDRLKKKLIMYDDFPWKISSSSPSMDHSDSDKLKYIGGVDMSFSKEDSSVACACLVVLELPSLRVVYHDFSLLHFRVPYVPGFLAFREAPVLLQLLDKMQKEQNPFYPQVLIVDGNGILHPRGFGLACHLGVLAHLPTIGVGKNLHHVDGLKQSEVRQLLQLKENQDEQVINLVGNSGFTWGVGIRPTLSCLKPIYVSVGHRISLETAVKIVMMTCKYRVPEPIRQADMRSREYLQEHQMKVLEEHDLPDQPEH